MNRADPNHRNLASYAVNIVGKTFEIIQTPDVRPGDTLLNFQCCSSGHIGYEVPAKVKKVHKITDTFYDIEFEGWDGKAIPRFAYSCLFGRLIENQTK